MTGSCAWCGAVLAERGGRGRPRTYCNETCRRAIAQAHRPKKPKSEQRPRHAQRSCTGCGASYTPYAPNQKRCDECRAKPRPPRTIACEGCGAVVARRANNNRFCATCRPIPTLPVRELTCAVCAAAISTRRRNQETCSLACGKELRLRRRREANALKRPTCTCEWCKAEFVSTTKLVQKFCPKPRKCAWSAQKHRDYHVRGRRPKPVEKTCATCGDSFVDPSGNRKDGRRHCFDCTGTKVERSERAAERRRESERAKTLAEQERALRRANREVAAIRREIERERRALRKRTLIRVPVVLHNNCRCCGEEFDYLSRHTGSRPEYCSVRCRRIFSGDFHLKRSRVYEVEFDATIKRIGVLDRDDWVCHICDEPIPRDQLWNRSGSNDLYGTIDHVIPMSRGGPHTWGNVRAAHLACNGRKSNRRMAS